MSVEISGLRISTNEAALFRKMTGKNDPCEAVAGVLTLVSKLRGSHEWQEARERALTNYQPAPKVMKKVIAAAAALDARRAATRTKSHVDKSAITRRR